MDASNFNPEENRLHAGVKEQALVDAITNSGFPLQGHVADLLNPKYGVTEEWSFIDRDTEELRSLDVFAWRNFEPLGQATCRAALLVECKSSVHPYVFFQNAINDEFQFPTLVGVPHVTITKRGDASHSRYQERTPNSILALHDSPFGKQPPIASAFTKAIAKGDKFNVSGNDPFNSIVMPLVKSLDHASGIYDAAVENGMIYPTLLLAVCVLDAPMVLVSNPSDGQKPSLTPWVRILRREAKSGRYGGIEQFEYIVDIVHRGFMADYFDSHVEQFLDLYRTRMQTSAEIIDRGGTVENLDNWEWSDVVAR